MAIRNLHGHAVSSAAPVHHQQVTPANVQFPDTMGPAGYSGGKKGGNFPAKASGKGRAQSPAQQSPPNSMAA